MIFRKLPRRCVVAGALFLLVCSPFLVFGQTWHYPVMKRPVPSQEPAGGVSAIPVVRLAGGEYEMAVMAVHHDGGSAPVEPNNIVLDISGLPMGYEVALHYLPPFEVERKSRWFDSVAVTGTWFDPVVPLAASPAAGIGAVAHDISFLPPLEAGQSAYFLLELRAPRGAGRRGGTVRAQVIFSRDGVEYTDSFPPLRVVPFDFDLPETHSLPLLAGIVPDDVFELHRRRGVSPEAELPLWLDYLALLREHRIVPYDPAPAKEFSWDHFETISIPLYRGDLTSDGVPAPAIRFPENPFPGGTAERVDFYRAVAARFREEGLLERTFYYVYDEPLLDMYTELIADAEELGEEAPEVRRLVTESYNAPLSGLVDIWCPDIAMLDQPVPFFPLFGKGAGLHPDFQVNPRPVVYARERAQGREMWLYTCTSAQYADLPNLFIDAPPAAARIIPWLIHRYDGTGMVYYRVSQAYKDENDPWSNQYFFAANGDGTLVYPGYPGIHGLTEHRAVASLRMKLLRDGLEDYEYLVLAEGAGGDGVEPGGGLVTSTTRWNHRLDEIVAARDRLAEVIEDAGEIAPAAPATPVAEEGDKIQTFHQVSQPAVVADYWYIPEFAAPTGRGVTLLAPAYRHNLASVLDTGRRSATAATRGRWEAYLQIAPVIGVPADPVIIGGYSAVGWTVSPETARRLERSVFIPYIGLEGGIISLVTTSGVETGYAGSILGGIHLWSNPQSSLALGGAWMHTTTDSVPLAFRTTLSLSVVLDRE